jgi:D-alanyl-D-alanine dipeptidase
MFGKKTRKKIARIKQYAFTRYDKKTLCLAYLFFACTTSLFSHGSGCSSSTTTYFNIRPAHASHINHAWHRPRRNNVCVKHDLVDIHTINPHIRVELRYATARNFTQKKIYRTKICYVRMATARKLDAVQKELESLGFGLKIWDGYRPHTAQEKLWKLVPDPRYVAPPSKGSKHTRGCSVDVTLVTNDGKEVLMPTDFDDFSPKAGSIYDLLAPEILKNRDLLKAIMIKHGFTPVSTEWWHFDDVDWETYPLIPTFS